METGRGGAAGAAWIVRGRVAAAPRVAAWIVRGRSRAAGYVERPRAATQEPHILSPTLAGSVDDARVRARVQASS